MARRPTAVSPGQVAADEPMKSAADAVADETMAIAEDASEAVSETAIQVVDTVKESVAELSPDVGGVAQKFNQGMTNTMKTAEEVLAFSQGNVEAFIKSGQIWSAGLQDLSKQMASSAQSSYEEAMAAFKALTTVKSLKEAVDLQVGLARSVMEKGVSESNKYSDASFKLAEQAIAPISSRVTLAVETFGKSV